MTDEINKRPFWASVFSEDGEPSFARVASGYLVVFASGWVTALVFHNHALPGELVALGGFVGLFYGIGKAGAVFTKKDGN